MADAVMKKSIRVFIQLQQIYILIISSFIFLCNGQEDCLTGYFTDVQNWAKENGSLSQYIENKHGLDLSGHPDVISQLHLLMSRELQDQRPIPGLEHYAQLNFYRNLVKYKINSKQDEVILKNVFFLSLAKNSLKRIPLFYTDMNGISGKYWNHLKYLSLFGNDFSEEPSLITQIPFRFKVSLNASSWEEISPRVFFSYAKEKSNWSDDLSKLDLKNLLELDLRNCSIEILHEHSFKNLSSLRRLYLSQNQIKEIYPTAFTDLNQLVHLDISKNNMYYENYEHRLIEGITLSKGTFKPLINLKSLDLSYTKLTQMCSSVLRELGPSLIRLSLCYTKLPYFEKQMFAQTSLKYLDISGNVAPDQLNIDAFEAINNTIEILYANYLGIKHLGYFKNLHNLRVLSLAHNNINEIDSTDLKNMEKLSILDLSDNRITNWNTIKFSELENLAVLQLNKNNLNLLSLQMLMDLKKLKYLSLGNNSFVCNCNVKTFIDKVILNDQLYEDDPKSYLEWYVNDTELFDIPEFPDPNNGFFYTNLSEEIDFHRAFIHYSSLISGRNRNYNKQLLKKLNLLRGSIENFAIEQNEDFYSAHNFSFHLLDYNGNNYECLDSKLNKLRNFSDIECEMFDQDNTISTQLSNATILMITLIIIASVIVFIMLLIWKWWYIRYFFLMMKNVAVLSIMGKHRSFDESVKEFNYDVFVSYCDEDRNWVLDEFLPHIENQSEISVCLHERDFQVGLSILENIISCMDRSRSLLMVISNRFLKSQWCQFEMHLAQHRLLETRREQLILVLLEDIPRRKRPNTLHYLMLTKTYIVWPKSDDEKILFWKRLKKAISQGKMCMENFHAINICKM